MTNDGIWHHFSKKEEAEQGYKNGWPKPNVWHIEWIGPGNYYCRTYYKRCPRNCCDDLVLSVQPAKYRLEEVKEEMVELARELKEARDKVNV